MNDAINRIPWGDDELEVRIPYDWHVAGILSPNAMQPVSDIGAEVRRSLCQPFGSLSLGDTARGKSDWHVAIVIDDASRPTPVADILPLVLSELNDAGILRSHITLIPATGLHRAMTEDEVGRRAGGASFAGLNWQNHDCDDPERLVHLGTTSRGSPVLVNKTVATADFIVSIGCIEPHIIASFGGGYKNLIPGVAGRPTVAHNHSLNCTPATFNMVGQPIEHNPMRLDLEEAGRMLKPPVFIVNAVLNSTQQAIQVVCGDPIAAHREGARVSAALYGVPIDHPADFVIADSHPMDQDLRQGVKALANTIRAVKPGGVHLTVVRADEGVGVFGLANRKLPLGRRALQVLAPTLLPLVPRLKLRGMGEEDRFFLYFALQAMRHGHLLMVAPTIPLEVQERLPFVRFQSDVNAAVASARQRLPGAAEVLIFPHGGITYPALR